MSEVSPSTRRRSPALLTLTLVVVLLLAVAGTGLWMVRRIAEDRAIAGALAESMTAPRVLFDGRPLEARYDLAIEDLAASRHQTAPQIRAALDRFASGDLLSRKRTGYDAFLAQLAARRFESAISTLLDLAGAAKTAANPAQPAWPLFTLTGVLEFGRSRAIAAEPLLQQAFELANRADALDTPAAARLLTALGAIKLSRSQPNEAEPFVRRAAAILRRDPAADLRDTARAVTLYAQSVATQGFPEEAEPLCSEALALTAQFRRTTGRTDTDQPAFEENYRKLLRERGLADAEIDATLRATLEPR